LLYANIVDKFREVKVFILGYKNIVKARTLGGNVKVNVLGYLDYQIHSFAGKKKYLDF